MKKLVAVGLLMALWQFWALAKQPDAKLSKQRLFHCWAMYDIVFMEGSGSPRQMQPVTYVKYCFGDTLATLLTDTFHNPVYAFESVTANDYFCANPDYQAADFNFATDSVLLVHFPKREDPPSAAIDFELLLCGDTLYMVNDATVFKFRK